VAEKYGAHIQYFLPGVAQWVGEANGPILKTMDASLDPLKTALDLAPRTKIVVFRKWYDTWEQDQLLEDCAGARIADDVVAEFRQSIEECENRGITVYVESLNEMRWDPWDVWPDRQAAFDVAFSEECAHLGVRPCVLSIAVGNPPGNFEERAWLWSKLYPALYAARAAGGALGIHLYGAPRMWEPDAQYYALRYRDDRQMWPADLRNLPTIVSEAGIDWGVVGGFDPPRGWKSSGDAAQYVEDLRWHDGEIAKDNYILGAVIFTVGGDDRWRDFDVTGVPEIQAWLVEPAEGGSVPIPTVITPENVPAGAPEQTVTFVFTASGIDGAANGFVGFEYPTLPDSEWTYGPAEQTEIGEFSDGTWQVSFQIPLNTTALPVGGVTGNLFVQIAELNGTPVDPVIDGGRFGPFPIDVLNEDETEPDEPDDPNEAAVNAARETVFTAAGDGYNADKNPLWLEIQKAVNVMKAGD
jgi:hypothetical protein